MPTQSIGLARSALIGAPAKIYTGSVAFWTEDTLRLRMDPSTREKRPSLFGRVGETVTDCVLKLSSFTPYGLLLNVSTLIPAFYTSPSMGARLVGDTDTAWKIWSNNGDLFTITAGCVTKPPSLSLGADGPIWGPMEISGVVGTGLDPGAVNSYYKTEVSKADPGGAFADTTYSQQLYTAAWGSVTGFTSFQAQDRWQIEFAPTLEPVKAQGWTRDFKLTSMMVTARCIPVGPTAAQIYTAVEESTAGAALGGKGLGDLTISGEDGTTTIVLKNMALKGRGYAFGASALRNDVLTWVNVISFTAGAPGALATLPAV